MSNVDLAFEIATKMHTALITGDAEAAAAYKVELEALTPFYGPDGIEEASDEAYNLVAGIY